MAVAANQVGNFRNQVTGAVDAMRGIDRLLAVIEDHGADDNARATFFQAAFGAATDNPDLTWAEFAAGIVALRALRTAWNTNKLAIVKLLK
jgi:hypothetical protein